jgi:CPA2 family monovalent cation:H+ antiporter-2
MHELNLIATITSGLLVALILGLITRRIGLSPIVGYLLAGIVVGRHTPGFIANQHAASELAEIGIVLLLFGVGLQFHIEELLAVRKVALPGAIVQIIVITLLGAFVSHSWGFSTGGALVFGLAIAVASTVVMVRILSDQGELHTPAARISIGWLVVEDILTVLALVALPVVFRAKPGSSVALTLGFATLKVAALVSLVLVGGRHAIPYVFGQVARTLSRELFTLTVLVTALGIAVGSAALFGASMALGAFLAGMIVGQSEFGARAATDALPMRDAFAVLYFVSVGMLFDPVSIMRQPSHVAITVLIILVAKPLSAFVVMRLLKKPSRLALPVSLARGQIGEFSFVLAGSAQALGILDSEAASVLVSASILSITANPLMYRLGQRLLARGFGAEPVATSGAAPESDTDTRDLAIIVGHGPTGQIVGETLRDNAIDTVFIDLNVDTIRNLARQGVRGVYGDASRVEVLEAAGLKRAAALFLTAANLEGAGQLIRSARELKPDLRVFVRAEYMRDVSALRKAGASTVVSAEGEVALAMASALLDDLGASPEQIEKERDRVHDALRQRAEADNSAPAPTSPRNNHA